jgi:hypothetical protein
VIIFAKLNLTFVKFCNRFDKELPKEKLQSRALFYKVYFYINCTFSIFILTSKAQQNFEKHILNGM